MLQIGRWLWFLVIAATTCSARAESRLVVQAPEGVQAAVATARQLKLDCRGTIEGRVITFANLLPDTPYDIRLTLADGTILQGADMSWYSPEPVKADVQPLDDDDRKQIREVFEGVKAFENRRNMLLLAGNHDRATVLAELIRDSGFHSSRGDEVIWRVELWYFKNQHGGWERISQQNKVLRRERFASKQEFTRQTGKLKWLAELGGIRVGKDRTASLTLPK